jgi:hypothetical protein
MTKRELISILLVVFGLLFYLVSNFYFGWNKEAQSVLEHICDWTIIASILLGFILKPIRVEKHYKTINTEKVIIHEVDNVVTND